MRTHVSIVAAAALAVAGLAFNSARADDVTNSNQGTPGGQNVAPASTQPSNVVTDADAKAIRQTLGQVTDTALMHDGFSTLATYLQRGGPDASSYGAPGVKEGTKGQPALNPDAPNKEVGTKTVPASEMVGSFKNYDDINSAVAQLQQDWKSKYNSDFAINGDNREMVYNDSFRIMQGNLGESARTAGERVAAGDTNTADNNAPAAPDDRAMHHAEVVIPQTQSFQGATLRLTNRGNPVDVWKVRIARDQDEQSIHDALLKQLNALHDDRANWPADKTEAYRAVSAHILSAFSRTDQGAAPTGQVPANQGQDMAK